MDNINLTNSIYTIHVEPLYKDFINTITATLVVLIFLHILMSGQKSTGLIGCIFNIPFSDTLSKILISITFYYLVFKKIITFV